MAKRSMNIFGWRRGGGMEDGVGEGGRGGGRGRHRTSIVESGDGVAAAWLGSQKGKCRRNE